MIPDTVLSDFSQQNVSRPHPFECAQTHTSMHKMKFLSFELKNPWDSLWNSWGNCRQINQLHRATCKIHVKKSRFSASKREKPASERLSGELRKRSKQAKNEQFSEGCMSQRRFSVRSARKFRNSKISNYIWSSREQRWTQLRCFVECNFPLVTSLSLVFDLKIMGCNCKNGIANQLRFFGLSTGTRQVWKWNNKA